MGDRYYIQDTRQYVGNCVYWWAIDGNGYTCHLDKAHLHTKDEADSITDNSDHFKAWPEDVVKRAATLQVDVQLLRAEKGFV